MRRVVRRMISGNHHNERESYLDKELKTMTYYEILKVRPNANQTEIKKAYINLARKHHPDLGGSSSTEFSHVVKAYQILSDERERAEYDDSLIKDKDYYKVGPVKIGWVFLLTIGMFSYAYLRQMNVIDDCPTSYKIKTAGTKDELEEVDVTP
jgi:hypothetical protein